MILDLINFLIYDFRLSDSAALAAVSKVPREGQWTLQTLWTL